MAKKLDAPQEERQIKFFDHLIENGGNVAQAAEAAEYDRSYAYQLAKKYSTYLLDRVEGSIVINTVKAAKVVIDNMTDDGTIPSAKLRMDAALQILDRAGLVKTEKSEIRVEAPNGVLILPAKKEEADATNGSEED